MSDAARPPPPERSVQHESTPPDAARAATAASSSTRRKKSADDLAGVNEQKSRELLDLKKKWGFDDPRFHNEDCDLCGNSAFREGYKENIPVQRAFDKAPEYPGILQKPCGEACDTKLPTVNEDLVKLITSQVLAALGKA